MPIHYTRTIKAPNNDAFGSLPQDDVDYLTDPDNKSELAGVLYYHLVAKPLMSMEIPQGDTTVDTVLEGETILVSKAGGVIMINEMSTVIDPNDVPACGGGVLHAIDEVLIPSVDPPEPVTSSPSRKPSHRPTPRPKSSKKAKGRKSYKPKSPKKNHNMFD